MVSSPRSSTGDSDFAPIHRSHGILLASERNTKGGAQTTSTSFVLGMDAGPKAPKIHGHLRKNPWENPWEKDDEAIHFLPRQPVWNDKPKLLKQRKIRKACDELGLPHWEIDWTKTSDKHLEISWDELGTSCIGLAQNAVSQPLHGGFVKHDGRNHLWAQSSWCICQRI